jgi:ABC-type lipoprotein release transport system permease subunit
MLLFRLGLRNLLLHKAKSLIVGFILLLGTMLVIVGSGLLHAVDQGMKRSLVNSVSAHIQLYSADSRDAFQLFGNFDGSAVDVGQITDFPRIRRSLLQLDAVKTVVPMGIDYAVTSTQSILERKLSELRDAVRAGDGAHVARLRKHVRRMIGVLKRELDNAEALLDINRFRKQHGDGRKVLARAESDAFWEQFDRDPFNALEFLENEVGPLGLSADVIWVRYIGTDTELFARTFDRFEIVDGEMIPPGKRGFLFNKRVYEQMAKNKTARRLDQLKERLDSGQSFQSCDDCRTWLRHNINQASSLAFELDEEAAAVVGRQLREHLASDERDIAELLREFMRMNQQNFARRYELFYELIAPRIVLYKVGIGDEFVLTAFSQGGYVRKVPLKVYGTFRFRSLDRSPLAGGFSVMDIISFRDLYGYMTDEKRKEQRAIRAEVGLADIERDNAEALFEQGDLVERDESAAFNPAEEVDLSLGGQRYTEEIHRRHYGKEQLWDGVVLNIAVMLKDGVPIDRALDQIRRLIVREKLGLTAIDWRKASGLVGQLVAVVQVVLYGAVFIVFVVAIIIINNSLLMSTMERTREIGTMRAIGAQRGFVMRMFLIETGVLALVFGGLGALGGSITMWTLQRIGIPATSDFFFFLFAGPRLRPELQPAHIGLALAVIASVAFVSTFYPSWLATRITPREAMASEE